MTLESARHKVRALLEKRDGFEEQGMKPGLFINDAGANKVGVDVFGDVPKVGVFISNTLEEEGHGIAAVFELRSQIMAIWEKEVGKDTPSPNLKDAEQHLEGKVEVLPETKDLVQKKSETKAKTPAIVTKTDDTKLTTELIKQYLCPAATDIEAFNFLQLCLRRDLNPFLKEAYLIKYGTSAATMVVGKDAFTRKAEESGKLEGFEAGIVLVNTEGTMTDRTGTILMKGETLLGGWAKVYRKDASKPFEIRVGLDEYDKHQNNWKTMPGTMIRKVALCQALREAFTKELGGCYGQEELTSDIDDGGAKP